MITALVQFRLPQPVTPAKAKDIFLSTAQKYRSTPGLLRKYYLLSKDGGTAGGVYLWQSQQDAERLYTEEWKSFVCEKYGAPPTITYFESPVVVDNVTHEVLADK
jgi:hypothetical protein